MRATRSTPAFGFLFRLILVAGPFAACPASFAQDSRLAAAAAAIEKSISGSGAQVGVYFKTLDGASEWAFQPDLAFHAASTMKVPVMIEIFRQARQGRLRLDEPIVVRNEFRSIVDGSAYALRAEDDSETELYGAEGQTRTVRELCRLMITVSSNLATNLLIAKLGVDHIRATLHEMGADGVRVLRGVEDGKAYEKGLNNTTTARGLGIVLEALASGKAAGPAGSKEMLRILEDQKFNEGIPSGLPRGVAVAHKTGEITKIHHDAAIVYAERPYILVILVGGLADKRESAALISGISKRIYQAVEGAQPDGGLATSNRREPGYIVSGSDRGAADGLPR
jgi:beta-lactamase class A